MFEWRSLFVYFIKQIYCDRTKQSKAEADGHGSSFAGNGSIPKLDQLNVVAIRTIPLRHLM